MCFTWWNYKWYKKAFFIRLKENITKICWEKLQIKNKPNVKFNSLKKEGFEMYTDISILAISDN